MPAQIQIVNPSFNIQAPGIYSESAQLFIEAGPMGISLAILNTGDCFQAAVVYSFPNKMTEQHVQEELQEILSNEPLLKKQYRKVHIIWCFPESILVPPELMNEENRNEMLNLVFGDARKNSDKQDFLYKHNLHNIYRIPAAISESFAAQLPYATQSHQYSLLANRVLNGGNELYAVFYTNSLTTMLCKEGKLQVIQNFPFNTPEDTSYQLLNVCRSFEVDPASVKLCISGMVDKRSNLYADIYKYFLHIEFDNLPGGFTCVEEIKAHPPHFFSHLFYEALCV